MDKTKATPETIIHKITSLEKSGFPVGQPLLPIRGKSMDLIVFRMTTAITAAARTVAGTGSGVVAADVLDTLLLVFAVGLCD